MENLGRCAARVLDLCRPINGFGVKTHNQDVFTMYVSHVSSNYMMNHSSVGGVVVMKRCKCTVCRRIC